MMGLTNNRDIQEDLYLFSEVFKATVRNLEVEFQARRLKMNCGLHQLFRVY